MRIWRTSAEPLFPRSDGAGARAARPSASHASAIEYPTMMSNSSLESALERLRDRRAFLKFLAGSPYIATLGGFSAAAFDTQQAATAVGDVITDPKAALDVMDFEE